MVQLLQLTVQPVLRISENMSIKYTPHRICRFCDLTPYTTIRAVWKQQCVGPPTSGRNVCCRRRCRCQTYVRALYARRINVMKNM